MRRRPGALAIGLIAGALLGFLAAGYVLDGGGTDMPAPGGPEPTASLPGEVSLTFPTNDPANGVMDALLQGRLRQIGACLYVVGPEGSRILPIWPSGFDARIEGQGSVTVVDETGAPVARTGRAVSMGGGMPEELPQALAGRIGECRGPYWIVGDVPA